MYYFSIQNYIITTGNHPIATGNHPGLGGGESSMTGGGNRLDGETSMVGIDWLPSCTQTHTQTHRNTDRHTNTQTGMSTQKLRQIEAFLFYDTDNNIIDTLAILLIDRGPTPDPPPQP